MVKRLIADEHDEAPELDAAFFARARPMSEVLPPEAQEGFRRPPGRPKALTPKRLVTLRLDADLVEYYRAGGDGWQTRLNADLRVHRDSLTGRFEPPEPAEGREAAAEPKRRA